MIQSLNNKSLLSQVHAGSASGRRSWLAYTLEGCSREVTDVYNAGFKKGWKLCTARELNVHLTYGHLLPSVVGEFGIAKYDIDAAVLRRIELDEFVEAIYVLLEFAGVYLAFYSLMENLSIVTFPSLSEFKTVLVKNLKYIEWIQKETERRILRRPIQWERVDPFVPEWRSIELDPRKDCRDSDNLFQEEVRRLRSQPPMRSFSSALLDYFKSRLLKNFAA